MVEFEADDALAAGASAAARDAPKLRPVILHRSGQVQLAFIYQNHCRHAGDGLGLRHDLHDGVGSHRFPALNVCEADRVECGDLPIARHEG